MNAQNRLETACGDRCSYKNGCKCASNGVQYPLNVELTRRLKIDRSDIQEGIYWVLLNYGPTRRSSIRLRMPGSGYFALDSALRAMRTKGLIESKLGAWCAIGKKNNES